MQITSFPRHIFWQYKPDADLPDQVILENLLRYGDLDDLLQVPKFFSPSQIAEVQRKIGIGNRWKKRAFFIKKILLAE